MNSKNRPDYYYLNDISLRTLSRGYLAEGIAKEDLFDAGVKRVNQLIDRAETILGFTLPTLRIAVKRGWLSPASPIWSNFGIDRGLPISCNGSYMDDTIDSILFKNAEIGMMTKHGAGTSLYMGKLRPFGSPIAGGGISEGAVHFARLTQEQVGTISQANVRRGNCAIWLDIDSPDIYEWLKMRGKQDGVHHPIQHLSFGVCIPRGWMKAMRAEEKGGEKRKLMAAIRNKRRETGYTYIFFGDNANDQRPQVLKDLNIEIAATNLCTEIMLPSSPTESFVCDLSSANLLWWHEWKDTPFIRELIYFLDAVLTEYCDKIVGDRFMRDALRFAMRWRALGLGVLGWHSLLQSEMIPFESQEASDLNVEIWKHIQKESQAASRHLARVLGEPEGMKGTGMRNLTLNAIAPTTSSSIILGQVSKQQEPWEANIFENDNAKGVFTQRNVHLEELLKKRKKNTPAVWKQILSDGGSVQTLDFLNDQEKAVFRTFAEIDQKVIIQQAIDRQPYIDQGQSLNIKMPPDATMKEDVDLIVMAHEGGLKSLYYREGLNAAQILARQNACVACEA